jgi:hypothetical protein
VVVWGDNSAGQGNVPSWLTPAKLIAAGGDETLGSRFFPLTQYPVEVAKDLLLIYNTNSADSFNVVSYYLAHRPRVAGANVLGIGSPTGEAIDLATFTNQIFPQVKAWLTSNPTKHPEYIILFPAIPSRIWTSTNCNDCFYESMSFGLSTNFQGIQPFVTSISMGLFDRTNDCVAYIDKLERFGTNFSPGNLLINASASGYGNTNYFFDDVLVSGKALGPGNDGRIGVLMTNPSALVTYTNGTDYGTNLAIHVTRGTNLAGYLYRGAHSALNNGYALNGAVQWHGANSWWIIETTEAFNGWRATGQGNFTQWFSQGAFGGTNWSGTPVAAVTHTDGPGLRFVNDARDYFGLWESGRPFAICAWVSRRTPYFQAVGDPFVRK